MPITNLPIRSFIGVATALLIAAPTHAHQHEQAVRATIGSHISEWLHTPLVVDAIKRQNAEHASISAADIGHVDKQWRAQTKQASRPLIDKVMARLLSRYLKEVKLKDRGLYTEIFVMDNKGLNVGQSDVTSDYWQGDEAKWKKTFLVGPDAVFIDKVEEDESTQQFQSQVSLSIVDPTTKNVIGAVTIGIDVEVLHELRQ